MVLMSLSAAWEKLSIVYTQESLSDTSGNISKHFPSKRRLGTQFTGQLPKEESSMGICKKLNISSQKICTMSTSIKTENVTKLLRAILFSFSGKHLQPLLLTLFSYTTLGLVVLFCFMMHSY